MKNHIITQETVASGAVDSLGKRMRPRPDVKGEGIYSSIRAVRARVAEPDGSEICAKAVLEMGENGKPERLVVSGLLPGGDTVLAHTRKGKWLLALEKVRTEKGDELDARYSHDHGCELKIASAIKVHEAVEDDPLSWADMLGDAIAEVRNAIEGRASAVTLEQVLAATFRFNDGSEVSGSALFGENAKAVPGCIKVKYGDGKTKIIDALQVKGAVNAFLVRGGIESLADLGPKFVNAANSMLAFTVEIDGNRYSGLVA